MNIGANIRRLRIEKELTQDKLAGMIGITPQAVSKWEREEGLPDITRSEEHTSELQSR